LYPDRTAWSCLVFVGKNMAAKDIHEEIISVCNFVVRCFVKREEKLRLYWKYFKEFSIKYMKIYLKIIPKHGDCNKKLM
jgi:hypothetical protein